MLLTWKMTDTCDPIEGTCSVLFYPVAVIPLAATNGTVQKILYAAMTTEKVDTRLEQFLNGLSCMKAIGDLANQFGKVAGKTDLEAFAMELNFYNAAGPEGSLTLAQAGMPQDVVGSNQTIAQFMGSSPANAKTLGYFSSGGPVTVTNSIIVSSLGVANMTLLHEELHSFLGADDAAIAQALELQMGFYDIPAGSNSQQFSSWLNDNCGKK